MLANDSYNVFLLKILEFLFPAYPPTQLQNSCCTSHRIHSSCILNSHYMCLGAARFMNRMVAGIS